MIYSWAVPFRPVADNAQTLLRYVILLILCVVLPNFVLADNHVCRTWYVQWGATGDGINKTTPFGSLGEAEMASAPCDTIFVLAAPQPLDGGIVLKQGQRLVGQGADPAKDIDADPFSGNHALVANSTGATRDGHAITCVGSCSIERLWVVEAFRTGVFAFDADGDLDTRRIRVTNFNTSQDVFPETGIPFYGIAYRTATNAVAVVRDSVIEEGLGGGILVVSYGTAHVESRIQSVNVRALTGGSGIVVVADGNIGSSVDAAIHKNIVSDAGLSGVQLWTTPAGPNQGSAVITRNQTSGTPFGILGVFQSDSAPELDRMIVEHNTVEIGPFGARGIEFIVGDHFDPRPRNHKGEWLFQHNRVTILGPSLPGSSPNGIELAFESSANLSGSAIVAHNTIIGDAAAEGAWGIQIAATSEVGRKANGDVTVRHNNIQMSGPFAVGMGFSAVAGLLTGPGAVPEWDIRMLFENNCVQDTPAGFVVADALGTGYSTEVYDLGGGDWGSHGRNNFIRTSVDIFFGGAIDPSVPATVPSSVLRAENNYWDADNPFAANPLEAFVIDAVGGAMFDTEPFLTNGPSNCGIDEN